MSSMIYGLVRQAIIDKKIVTGNYDGYYREMCPHTIGRSKTGDEQALFYQTGGESKSGLGPPGSPKNWRCIPLSRLSNVKVIDGAWGTASNHSMPQTCVADIDIEVDF